MRKLADERTGFINLPTSQLRTIFTDLHGRERVAVHSVLLRTSTHRQHSPPRQHHEQDGGRHGGHDGHGRLPQVFGQTSGGGRQIGLGRRHAAPDGGSGAGPIHFRSLHAGLFAQHGLSRSGKVFLYSHESQGSLISL